MNIHPIEAWLYFFRRADEMTRQDIHPRFDSPAFLEAAKVLEMIQRTPDQRSQYELRLKSQRDERARLEQARAEGEKIGEARGEARGAVRGRVELLSELVGRDTGSLDGLSLEQLSELENALQRQLRGRDV